MQTNRVYYSTAAAAPITANGPLDPFPFQGGLLVMGAYGTFDSAVVALQNEDVVLGWTNVGPQNGVAGSGTIAANGSGTIYVPPGRYRLNVTGVVTAASLSAWVGSAHPFGS